MPAWLRSSAKNLSKVSSIYWMLLGDKEIAFTLGSSDLSDSDVKVIQRVRPVVSSAGALQPLLPEEASLSTSDRIHTMNQYSPE